MIEWVGCVIREEKTVSNFKDLINDFISKNMRIQIFKS